MAIKVKKKMNKAEACDDKIKKTGEAEFIKLSFIIGNVKEICDTRYA